MQKQRENPESQPENWYAVRVEPGREARVEWVMEHRFGLERYIPRADAMVTLEARQWQRDLGVKDEKLVTDLHTFRGSLVPGFVFVRCEMTDELAHAIGESPYVLRLLPSNRAPMAIKDAAIDAMRKMCDQLIRQTGETPDLDWMLGKTFRIEKDVWAGREGPCIAFDSKGNPILLIEVFKALQPIPIPLDAIDLNPVPTQDVDEISGKAYIPGISKRRSVRR